MELGRDVMTFKTRLISLTLAIVGFAVAFISFQNFEDPDATPAAYQTGCSTSPQTMPVPAPASSYPTTTYDYEPELGTPACSQLASGCSNTKLDLYRPNGLLNPPLIVFMHGGGLEAGSNFPKADDLAQTQTFIGLGY